MCASICAKYGMTLGSGWKHALHVICIVSLIMAIMYNAGCCADNARQFCNLINQYGYVITVILYIVRYAHLIGMPQCVCNMLGLVLYNSFRDEVLLKVSPSLAPFVCFRIVTRGDYPQLVREKIALNIGICQKVGFMNYVMEVVTDARLHIETGVRVCELLVPPQYRTKSGALYKARALQYSLETNQVQLKNSDWIVHLDEETQLTVNSLHGILNFCSCGHYQFGQGVITYGTGEIVNWITTLADSMLVANDVGVLRLQMYLFHRPLFGWKGSFIVAQMGAERQVTFDHGEGGSLAEDVYFGMTAIHYGYNFSFVEGEMCESSPFTFLDYVRQRKRWFQGVLLAVHCELLPKRVQILLSSNLYCWATAPLGLVCMAVSTLVQMPSHSVLDLIGSFGCAVFYYMHAFGTVKMFSARYHNRQWILVLCGLGSICIAHYIVFANIIIVISGLFGRMTDFYVVKKGNCKKTRAHAGWWKTGT